MTEISISQAERDRILSVRSSVDVYREEHRILHSVSWHKGVPEEHTLLLIELKKALVELGYKEKTALDDAFSDSRLFNARELGFTDMNDYHARADKADSLAFKEKWH